MKSSHSTVDAMSKLSDCMHNPGWARMRFWGPCDVVRPELFSDTDTSGCIINSEMIVVVQLCVPEKKEPIHNLTRDSQGSCCVLQMRDMRWSDISDGMVGSKARICWHRWFKLELQDMVKRQNFNIQTGYEQSWRRGGAGDLKKKFNYDWARCAGPRTHFRNQLTRLLYEILLTLGISLVMQSSTRFLLRTFVIFGKYSKGFSRSTRMQTGDNLKIWSYLVSSCQTFV